MTKLIELAESSGPVDNSVLLEQTAGVARQVTADKIRDYIKADILKDDITQLIGITSPYNGQRVSVRGYHPSSSIGGGDFVYNSSKAKSAHNGGTVISDTVPWSGTSATLGNFLSGNGETDPGGSGCWERSGIGGKPTNVAWFGAENTLPGAPLVDSTASQQAAMTHALANDGVVFYPGNDYLYDDDDYYEITGDLIITGENSAKTRVYCQGTGGEPRSGVGNWMFWCSGNSGSKVSINNIRFTQQDSDYKGCFYVRAANDNFGPSFNTYNCRFIAWQNTGVHGVRLFDSQFIYTNFLPPEKYTGTFEAARALDDAGIRLWGADGTSVAQDHSFSNGISFINCYFLGGRYGIDGEGIANGVAQSCTFESNWVAIKNRKNQTSVGGVGTVSTEKSGFRKAEFEIQKSCWFESIAAHAAINQNINTTTGAELGETHTAEFWYDGNSETPGSPVEDDIGLGANNDDLTFDRIRDFGYLGDFGGGTVPNYTFRQVFAENPNTTYILESRDESRYRMPFRVDDEFRVRNPSDTNNDYLAVTSNGTRTEYTSTHNHRLSFTTSSTGVELSGSGTLRPLVDNTQQCGQLSLRWSEFFAGNGTVNTSDEREKTDWTQLSDAELAAAKEIAGSIQLYRWIDAKERKGDGARWHIGVGAQSVIEIMESHALDPMRYSFICYDEWPDDLDAGVAAGDRYGIRPDQLSLFIAAAQEQRLRNLESAR